MEIERIVALIESEIKGLAVYMEKQERKFEAAKTEKERARLNEIMTGVDGQIAGLEKALAIAKANS